MITSDIQELNISDLNEYEEDRALLLTENEEGYWRKLTLDPNKNATGTGYPFAYQDNEIISTTNIDESYNNRVSNGTDYVDMYYDFSSGVPTWGLQTSDSATYRWQPDDRVNVAGTEPKVDADSQGNAWMIYKNIVLGENVSAKYYDSTFGLWALTVTLDNLVPPEPMPDIAMSESGIAIAAWIHDNGLERQIQAAYYDPGTTTWTSNIDLSIPTATEDSNPKVAINDSGDGVAVWQSPQNDGSIIVQAAIFDGATKTWQGFPTNISQGIYENIDPRVGIDNNGNILVVWEQLNPSSNRSLIFYASYDAGTSTWSSYDVVPSTLNDAYLPELSMTPSGDAMAVWVESSSGSSYIIEANKYNGTTKSWNPVAYDIDIVENNQYRAKVSMSTLGTAIVVYSKRQSGVPGGYYIQASKYNPDTDQWESPEIIDQTNVVDALPDVSMNDVGNAVAIWVKEAATDLAIYSSSYQEIIKKWSLPDQISVERTDFYRSQSIISGNRAASIYQATDATNPSVITGAVAFINPNILTANDSIVSFAFRKVQEVGEPEVATDAATKNYVDSAIAAAIPALLEMLQNQGLLKEGVLEAMNKKDVKKISKKKRKKGDNK